MRDMEEKRSNLMPLMVALLLLTLPILYLGTYLALIDPGFGKVHPYRLGSGYSSAVFWPLEQLDRRIRPDAWRNPWE
jgi:hypothetical protein